MCTATSKFLQWQEILKKTVCFQGHVALSDPDGISGSGKRKDEAYKEVVRLFKK